MKFLSSILLVTCIISSILTINTSSAISFSNKTVEQDKCDNSTNFKVKQESNSLFSSIGSTFTSFFNTIFFIEPKSIPQPKNGDWCGSDLPIKTKSTESKKNIINIKKVEFDYELLDTEKIYIKGSFSKTIIIDNKYTFVQSIIYNGKYQILLNGKMIEGYDEVYDLSISRDNNYLGLVAKQKGKLVIVIDGNTNILPYDNWPDESKNRNKWFNLSANGVDYVLKIGKGGKDVLVINGVESEPFDSIAVPRFYEDKITFIGSNGDDKYIVYDDGIKKDYSKYYGSNEYYNDLKNETLFNKKTFQRGDIKTTVSPNGKNEAYLKQENGFRKSIIKDGKKISVSDKQITDYIFCDNSKIYYIAGGAIYEENNYSPIYTGEDGYYSPKNLECINNKPYFFVTDKENKKYLVKDLEINKDKKYEYINGFHRLGNEGEYVIYSKINNRLKLSFSSIDIMKSEGIKIGNNFEYINKPIIKTVGNGITNNINKKVEKKKEIKVEKKRENIDPKNLVRQAWTNDSINRFKRTYGDSSDETILGDNNSRNIIWGMEGKDILIGGELDDIFIVVGDMSKYGKRDTLETLQILGFPIDKINGVNYNISGSPKLIDGGGGNDKLFITGDIDLSKTKIEGIEDIKIH